MGFGDDFLANHKEHGPRGEPERSIEKLVGDFPHKEDKQPTHAGGQAARRLARVPAKIMLILEKPGSALSISRQAQNEKSIPA